MLAELANLLTPFTSITKVISASNYSTVGETILLFAGLKAYLDKPQNKDYILQEQVDEMNHIFTNYFCEINEALHISAFFDPRYKNLAYENMSWNDILLSIKRIIANYENSDIILPSQTPIQTLRKLTNLSASETRSYFRTLLMSD